MTIQKRSNTFQTNEINKHQRGYQPGHPWYYKLGGKVLSPKQILATVKSSDYQGYRADDIRQADNKSEPQRSGVLRKLREETLKSLTSDLSCYRIFTCELREYRALDETGLGDHAICSDIHTSMSLKHNHLYNDFAHLNMIDGLLSRQPDLFDC